MYDMTISDSMSKITDSNKLALFQDEHKICYDSLPKYDSNINEPSLVPFSDPSQIQSAKTPYPKVSSVDRLIRRPSIPFEWLQVLFHSPRKNQSMT